MKLIFAATLLSIVATSAFAADTKIINNSGMPIDELYVAEHGKKAWSANLIDGAPEGALDSGKDYKVAGLADGVWDMRIEAPDEGVSCVIPHVVVKNGETVELIPEMANSCK